MTSFDENVNILFIKKINQKKFGVLLICILPLCSNHKEKDCTSNMRNKSRIINFESRIVNFDYWLPIQGMDVGIGVTAEVDVLGNVDLSNMFWLRGDGTVCQDGQILNLHPEIEREIHNIAREKALAQRIG